MSHRGKRWLLFLLFVLVSSVCVCVNGEYTYVGVDGRRVGPRGECSACRASEANLLVEA